MEKTIWKRDWWKLNDIFKLRSSGGAPAEKGDWDPVSSQASKHSQAVWLFLWRDQVGLMQFTSLFNKTNSFSSQDLSHPWVCSSWWDVQVSAEAAQAKVSPTWLWWMFWLSLGVLNLALPSLLPSTQIKSPITGEIVLLHVNYDISCFFNCACIFSFTNLILSPLRLHQTFTASLRGPVTPVTGLLK